MSFLEQAGSRLVRAKGMLEYGPHGQWIALAQDFYSTHAAEIGFRDPGYRSNSQEWPFIYALAMRLALGEREYNDPAVESMYQMKEQKMDELHMPPGHPIRMRLEILAYRIASHVILPRDPQERLPLSQVMQQYRAEQLRRQEPR